MTGSRFCSGLFGLLAVMSLPRPALTAAPIASTTLPLTLIDNRPFVAVLVDGKGPFSFILDTGSSETTVSAGLAKSLNLSAIRSDTDSGAGGQKVQFQRVHVTTVALGPFSIGPLEAPAIDTSTLSAAIGFAHFDGVLGVEIFRHNVVTIDAARRQLSWVPSAMFQPDADAVALPFTLDGNEMPVVTASVSGVTGSFEVDTGDRSSLTLFAPFWRAHKLDSAMAPTVKVMTGYGIGGPILGIVGRPANFSMGSFFIARPVIRLSLQKSGAFTASDRAGSIGMGMLKRFAVSFDYQRHTMWLAKGADFNVPDAYDRSGLWLGLAEAALEVVGVTPGSPAAKAGIQNGDRLTKVGDVSAGSDTLFKIRTLLQTASGSVVTIHAVRNGSPYKTRLITRDQIAPP